MSDAIYVDPTFRRVVEAHIAGNLVVTPTESPLILGIFGPPGEGKTFQVDVVCAELGLGLSRISPGELESENAGHPAQLIRKEYLKAATGSGQTVLIVNDIDTVLGNWGSLVQYTVNRQVVIGQLMALCDYPNEVAGTPCRRVPLIITGNNHSMLHGPLLRPGRARVFGWIPSLETRIPIVSGIFPELSEDDVIRLLEYLPGEPVSFWADVRAAVWEAVMADWFAGQGRSALRRMLATGEQMSPSLNHYTYESVRRMADELQKADVRHSTFVST